MITRVNTRFRSAVASLVCLALSSSSLSAVHASSSDSAELDRIEIPAPEVPKTISRDYVTGASSSSSPVLLRGQQPDPGAAPSETSSPGTSSTSDKAHDEVKDDVPPIEPKKEVSEQTVPPAPYFEMKSVDRLSNDIVRKELELLRFNTYYRMETADQSKAQSIRQVLYNLLGSGVSLGGAVTIMAHRWSHRRPRKEVLVAGSACLLTGQSIVMGGIFLEKTLDLIKERKLKKEGLKPDDAARYVRAHVKGIDDLIAEREAAIRKLSLAPELAKALSTETEVLKEAADMSVVEFAHFYATTRMRNWSRNASYINGLIATGCGGDLGSLVGMLTSSNRRPSMAVPAGIGFVLSGAAIIASPMVNRYVSKKAKSSGLAQFKAEIEKTRDSSLVDLSKKVTALQSQMVGIPVASRSPGVLARLEIYNSQVQIFREQVRREAMNDQKNKDIFVYRQVANTAMGGTKIAWGSMLINAGSTAYNSPIRFNRTVAQAATVYTVSQSLWLADTLYSAKRPKALKFPVGGELQLPVQKLEERLKLLESLEEDLPRVQ